MTPASTHRRGQPLAALVLIVAAWIGGRALTWTPMSDVLPAGVVEAVRWIARPLPSAIPPQVRHVAGQSGDSSAPNSAPQTWPLTDSGNERSPPRPVTIDRPQALPTVEPAPTASVRSAGAHQLLWMAAVAQVPMPLALAAPPLLPRAAPATARRWSGDAWLFVRQGDAASLSAAGAPSYGASQVGAVLRYRLAPASALRPTLYLRAASALGLRQKEAALGVAVRPLAAVAVAAMIEARVSDDVAGRRVRPAAMLVTEMAPFRLPGGLDTELYAQAGYIAGRDATPFGDGQARITRRVAERGRIRFDIGGGAWAGGQRGAARLDLGPTASLSLPVGAGAARVAADWRFRIAGDAKPASGPAVTISAGF